MDEYFEMEGLEESPFMMYAVNVRMEKVEEIPAITHVDNTCRVQTLKKEFNKHFYDIIKEFYDITNTPNLLNTSFNLAGEPMVESITDALNTLENAIRKIDKESRTRFKETFDELNKNIKEMFPKLFGGGHAYLQLTGDELLSTGVSIMAQPPGKKNTNIHLLSGGEKALLPPPRALLRPS